MILLHMWDSGMVPAGEVNFSTEFLLYSNADGLARVNGGVGWSWGVEYTGIGVKIHCPLFSWDGQEVVCLTPFCETSPY